MKIAPQLKDYEVVQLINEDSFAIYSFGRKTIFRKDFWHKIPVVFLSGLVVEELRLVIPFFKDKKWGYSHS